MYRTRKARPSTVSHILQIIRPDVLLLNEFDYEPQHAAVEAFQTNYLAVPQAAGLEPLQYQFAYTDTVNTGVPSGRDFNHDGKSEGPQDCFGFGNHPGQYGMVLLSRFPIDSSSIRTFQFFLWADMPGAVLPTDPATGQPWYSEEDLQVFRLSSKSHWDVPIDIPCGDAPAAGCADASSPGCNSPTRRVHMLLHHPTPPAFDGPEHRNVMRNHDEIRLWADYVGCGGPESGTYLVDDAGVAGGLAPGASFVIMGDHNADPLDGGAAAAELHLQPAIDQLLGCCQVNAGFVPTSEGGRQAGNRHPWDETPAETKTSSFDLRVDYVLPSRDLPVLGGGVWWPVKQDPLAGLLEASDHRPVYLDVEVCAQSVATSV
ncbi:hypothetical protein OEZ85_012068 [Tetradesmus obliquus]|uniref:Endonuclease/exonuclease/phosphatase domain-containing protein n=1 Tax=Tetradesmus obliquus TaxID=3088 RepID=A0ABY8TUJ2_TETOB|nr:hypothetical protein OEZ85_012068 [Tetradesmus obliquus]